MLSTGPTPGRPGALPPRWRLVLGVTIAATWALMVLGALTRASMAGVACPDWPLCHGHVVPPLEQAAYPKDPSYLVTKVYLEFLHRVLAGVVSVGAVLVGLRAWVAGARRIALALWALLGLQVLAGAVTVWLRNAPLTVVLHLALALGFLAALLLAGRRLSAAPAAGERISRRVTQGSVALVALVAGQMLVGATVSSGYYGLACERFPFCSGGLLPEAWTTASAWQMTHRALGTVVLLVAIWVSSAAWRSASGGGERLLAVLLAAGLAAEVLLGGMNVWLRVPPWASAAHLGLAAALFALVARRALAALEGPSTARAEVAPPG